MIISVHKIGQKWVFDPDDLGAPELQNELNRKTSKGYVDLQIKKPRALYSSNQQNLWHKLVGLYYTTGLHSSENYESLRNVLKYRYGMISSYIYILDNGEIVTREPSAPAPESVHERIPLLTSTTGYDKDSYSHLIDGTIAEMLQSGIMQTQRYSVEFQELLDSLGGK